MLVLSRDDVLSVLDGAEDVLCDVVADAYRTHAEGRTVVPHSVFLTFPGTPNRIIALPAFLDDDAPVAGMKWISSFPGNIATGTPRASAAMLLNSMVDGRPVALMEAAVVSARRTAASAAVAAARLLADAPPEAARGVSLIGCGVINFEVLRFLRARLPIETVAVYDVDPARAHEFAGRVSAQWPGVTTTVVDRPDDALAAHRLVSLATTATEPHLGTDACRPGTVVLHVSLRDLTPESIIGAVNVVDDPDHVCRAATSLDLAQRVTGDRRFIHASIGDLLNGTTALRYSPDRITVFSPFGLGVLDIALGRFVLDRARERGVGVPLVNFGD